MSRVEVVVEYEYEALQDDELTLRLGDIIKNVRCIEEDGWMEGDLNGKRGLFPDNFVKVREGQPGLYSFLENCSFVTPPTRSDLLLSNNRVKFYCTVRNYSVEASTTSNQTDVMHVIHFYLLNC